MTHTRKKVWELYAPNPGRVAGFAKALGLDPLTATLLLNRGIQDIAEAERFLRPDFEHLHDPFGILNMRTAVDRIVRAVAREEPILVFGDDDVDGITSTTTIYTYLRAIGAKVRYFIPRRFEHGHGFNMVAVEAATAEPTSVVIAADCGLTSVAEVDHLHERGIDTIIVDHHSIPRQLPAAILLNPRQPGDTFPFKDLAAVGVAFNLVLALDRHLHERGVFAQMPSPDLTEYLDLVALGTVADVVPLVDENRVLVRLGIEVLRKRRRCGIAALLEKVNPENEFVTERTICYRLAPRLNAAGRMGDANDCVRLLSAKRYGEAQELAIRLERYNEQRQQAEGSILREAIEIATEQVEEGRRILVVAKEGWHQGVLGIVASRLLEKFHRPTLLIAMNNGKARGSARSPEAVNILACMREVDDLFMDYGGHSVAAGLSLAAGNVSALKERIELAADQVLEGGRLPPPIIRIDGEITLRELTATRLKEIELLGPFGAANPEPCFLIKRLRTLRSRTFGRNHLRVRLRGERAVVEVIGFSMGDSDLQRGKQLDVVLTPRIAVREQDDVELQLLAFESSP